MSARALNILLLEDHVDTALVFARVLRHEGHSVSVAGTLSDARLSCESNQFDLILCDVELPDGRGLDVLGNARSTCRHVQGIVISAHDDSGRQRLAKEAGFAAYLVKPVTADALRATIRQVTRFRRAQGAYGPDDDPAQPPTSH